MTSVAQNKMVIGLVGGIASGKTMIAEYLSRKGATIFNASVETRKALSSKEMVEMIFAQWPVIKATAVIQGVTDITILKKELAKIVESDDNELAFLEGLLFPIVRNRMEKFVHVIKQGVIVIDAPLLFEIACEKYCNEIWFINMPLKERFAHYIRRFVGDDIEIIRKDFKLREARRMSLLEKMRRSTFQIPNRTGQLYTTWRTVDKFWNRIITKL
jgi:dephospho-CoA kinase